MKKYLLAIIAMLLCITSSVDAGDKIVFTKPASIIRPKSPLPETSTLIVGEYDDEQIVISITGYNGEICITIADATTLQFISTQYENIVSPDTVGVDLSNLPCSIYTIIVELDNGDCYFANIQI